MFAPQDSGTRRALGAVVAPPRTLSAPAGYDDFLRGVKERIASAQTRAALALSRELLALYYRTGADIVLRQEREGWGASVIKRLAADLQAAFPGVQGFSKRNLEAMRALFLAYRPESNCAAAAAQLELPAGLPILPWGHHLLLLDKVHDAEMRTWYGHAAVQHGWSRAVLAHHIQSRLYDRRGAPNNFTATLPPIDSDLAQQILKDPYNFDFLALARDAKERDLELGLVERIRQLLLELGTGFAFVGNQVPLRVGDSDFYIDLLFYNLKLRRYFVIELKMTQFKPEFVGQLGFYLTAIDEQVRQPSDGPTIGLLLCTDHDRVVAEYALRDVAKPVGIARYRLADRLPKELAATLPSIDVLTAELAPSSETVLTSEEDVILRRYFGLGQERQWTIAEIAARHGTPEADVKRALDAAVEKLRGKLGDAATGRRRRRGR